VFKWVFNFSYPKINLFCYFSILKHL
jgi:hypothetical protein